MRDIAVEPRHGSLVALNAGEHVLEQMGGERRTVTLEVTHVQRGVQGPVILLNEINLSESAVSPGYNAGGCRLLLSMEASDTRGRNYRELSVHSVASGKIIASL